MTSATLATRVDAIENMTSGLPYLQTTPQVYLSYLTATTGTPGAGQFRSSIIGRSSIPDLSQDLGVRFGVERICIQQIVQVFSEQGSNGESVYKPVNDKFDQIRFVGNISQTSNQHGSYVLTNSTNNFIEIIFYGTGLNMIGLPANEGASVSIDGAAETTAPYAVSTSTLQSRNYATNTILPLVSGLTPGLHTAKIRNNGAGSQSLFTYGFEIINDSPATTTGNISSGSNQLTNLASTTGIIVGNYVTGAGIPIYTTVTAISGATVTMSANATATTTGLSVTFNGSLKVLPGTAVSGGNKATLAALATTAWNTGFTNISGTSGTRGGRVLVYQKADGSIAKDIQYVDTAAATMSSANHTNEEVIRTFFWREFGCGRTDDWSTLVTSFTTRSFTIDDGTTSLGVSGSLARSASGQNYDSLGLQQGSNLFFTFIGSGLDLVMISDAGTSGTQVQVSIDGGTAADVFGTGVTHGTAPRIWKIASGLPYGTHTIKLTVPAVSSSNPGILHFITYGPKKPALPSGAVDLGDYTIVADHVVATSAAQTFVSQGVIRKMALREVSYQNAMQSITIDTTLSNCGFRVAGNSASGTQAEFTFFGTGVEYHGITQNGETVNYNALIDGLALNSGANAQATSTFQANGVTGLSFSAAGQVTGVVAGSGNVFIRISGLPLGKHTIRMTNNVGTGNTFFDSFDVITPIHAVKSSGQLVLQNTLSVGNQGINDRRTFGTQLIKTQNNCQTISYNNLGSITLTTYIPLTDAVATVKTTGAPIEIAYSAVVRMQTAGQTVFTQLFVDGRAVGNEKRFNAPSAQFCTIADSITVPLATGEHTILIMVRVSGGTADSATDMYRTLDIKELI